MQILTDGSFIARVFQRFSVNSADRRAARSSLANYVRERHVTTGKWWNFFRQIHDGWATPPVPTTPRRRMTSNVLWWIIFSGAGQFL